MEKTFLLFIFLFSFPFATRAQQETIKLLESISMELNRYEGVKAKLKQIRNELSENYFQAKADSEKAKILKQARDSLFLILSGQLLPFWFNTEWAYYGKTQKPGQGKISSSYFTARIFQHAGFQIDLLRLPKLPPNKLVYRLSGREYIKQFLNTSFNKLKPAIIDWGRGIYLLGSKFHIGFLVNTGEDIFFIHASYLKPWKVVKEKADSSTILNSLPFCVLGNFLGNDKIILKWLKKESL